MQFNKESLLLFSKTIDWSILQEGVSIPVQYHPTIIGAIGEELKHGEKKRLNVRLDNIVYSITLTNIDFDRNKYPDHTDIIQLRWSKNGSFAQHLRQIFNASYNDLLVYRSTKKDSDVTKPIINESISFIYNYEDMIIDIECITADEYHIAKKQISSLREDEFEIQQNYYKEDSKASIEYKDSTVRIRRINRSIITGLKLYYDYHCQICGTCFDKYDIKFVEAHHIDYFVHSLNNNSDNIMVVCPNHHRLIHYAKPEFLYSDKCFIYPNGLREPLLINKHIGWG